MDPDFIFLVPYDCPKCHEALEARLTGPPAWLRCPTCGRASLPPENSRPRGVTFLEGLDPVPGDFAPYVAAALPVMPRGMAPLPLPEAARTPPTRLLLGTGFFLGTILALFSLLDSSPIRAGVFALAAIACLVFLSRNPSRPGPG